VSVISSKRLMLASIALLMGLAGCASAGGGGSSSGRGGNPNRITQENLIDQSYQSIDLLSLIQQIRPRWLTNRGRGNTRVIVDGAARMGGIDELRSFRVPDIQEVEFLSASDATTRFGTGYEAGAILVQTRRR